MVFLFLFILLFLVGLGILEAEKLSANEVLILLSLDNSQSFTYMRVYLIKLTEDLSRTNV